MTPEEVEKKPQNALYYRQLEVKSNDMELQTLLQQINTRGTINLDKNFEKAMRRVKGLQTHEEVEEERLVQEKIKKASEAR